MSANDPLRTSLGLESPDDPADMGGLVEATEGCSAPKLDWGRGLLQPNKAKFLGFRCISHSRRLRRVFAERATVKSLGKISFHALTLLAIAIPISSDGFT